MNIESQELADDIRATARSIHHLSHKLRNHWRNTGDQKSHDIGFSLFSQAMQLDEFAKEIEKETT